MSFSKLVLSCFESYLNSTSTSYESESSNMRCPMYDVKNDCKMLMSVYQVTGIWYNLNVIICTKCTFPTEHTILFQIFKALLQCCFHLVLLALCDWNQSTENVQVPRSQPSRSPVFPHFHRFYSFLLLKEVYWQTAGNYLFFYHSWSKLSIPFFLSIKSLT